MKGLTLKALGLVLLIILLPIGYFWPVGSPAVDGVLLQFVTPGLYVSDAAVLLLVAALVRRYRDVQWGPAGIVVPLFALAALGFVTAGTAVDPWLALYSAGRWLAAGAIVLSLRQEGFPPERLVGLFLVTVALQAAVGLMQALAQRPVGLPGEMALSLGQAGAAIVRLEGGNWLRAYGLTFHPNVFGGYLVVGVILCTPILHRRPVRIVWWCLFLALFLTFSRSAWLAVGLALPVVLVWLLRRYPERRQELAMAVTGAAAVLLLSAYVWRAPLVARLQPLLAPVVEEGVGGEQPAGGVDRPAGPGAGTGAATDARTDPLLSRLAQIRVALSAVRADPWRGVGAGNFSLLMVGNAEAAIPQPVHNVPLLLAAEVGIVGALLWVALGLLVVFFLASSWRDGRGWAVAAAAAWLALFIIGLFDFYPWGLNSGRLLSAFVLGLVARAGVAYSPG